MAETFTLRDDVIRTIMYALDHRLVQAEDDDARNAVLEARSAIRMRDGVERKRYRGLWLCTSVVIQPSRWLAWVEDESYATLVELPGLHDSMGEAWRAGFDWVISNYRFSV